MRGVCEGLCEGVCGVCEGCVRGVGRHEKPQYDTLTP